MKTKKIILVFKTHFDIGFTDLAENVIRNYGEDMLRRVIETCNATAHMGPLRYVWTMPAWPLLYIADHCGSDLKPELDRLIRAGQIVWHALPFTSHTDCCAPEEYAAALQYARVLSERYGKPYPIAGKMTDVPGHGLMLPELLSQAGIRFLHLGCNQFATPPDVPRLFFWQSPQGGKVLTMYSKGGYGTSLLPPEDWPFPVWMALMHTQDNCGPQTAELLEGLVAKAKRACPDAEIVCGTMDDFCRELERYDLSSVPVVTKDLADTWIHGIGSYPEEVAELRRNRLRARGLHRAYLTRLLGGGAPLPEWKSLWDRYYEQTALFEEHTWGADVKTWLGPDRVYDKEDFLKARTAASCQFMERSWNEQRDRMRIASDTLETIGKLLPEPSVPEKRCRELRYSRTGDTVTADAGRYRLTFNAVTGRIDSVADAELHTEILKSRGEHGVFSYQYDRAGIEDVTEFLRSYGYRFTDWGILDYGRSAYPECDHFSRTPVFDGYEALPRKICFRFHNEESAELYGDCRSLTLTVSFPEEGGIEAELTLHDKQASPFIEAGSFIIPLAGESRWLLGRPCAAVDPEKQIVHCANHSFFCLENEASALWDRAAVTVFPQDTPLMSIGSSGLYDYEPEFPEGRAPEMWFDLFNNMWGTNFPQWIEGDFTYHFRLVSSAPDAAPKLREKPAFAPIEGIPEGLEPVFTAFENGTIRLLLRDHSGSAGPRTLRFPGKMLQQTDLRCCPLSDPVPDELTLSVRPYGLHCIEICQPASA